MSKNKNSKVPQKKQTSDIVAPGKAVSDSQEYKDTVEIREKRIGIVFKVIYVIAIFFATIFLDIGKTFGNGLTNAYVLEVCAASFLLVMIGYMVFYIVNEMKCLKLNATDLPKLQVDMTEKSYSKIFSNLYVSGITSLLCLWAGIENLEKINQSWLVGMFLIAFLAWLGSFVAQVYTKNKVAGIILQGASCITVTIMIISILLLPALNIATQA